MSNTQLILSLLTTLFISAASLAADILPLEGALSAEERMPITDSYFLKIKYSSRSTHTGLFGYGWCSEIDDQVQMNSVTKNYEWQQCGNNLVLIQRKNSGFFYSPRLPGNLWIKTSIGWMLYNYGKKRKAYDYKGRVSALFLNGKDALFLKYEADYISVLSIGQRAQLFMQKETHTVLEIDISGRKKYELVYDKKLWKGYKTQLVIDITSAGAEPQEEYIQFNYNVYANLTSKKQYLKSNDNIMTLPIWSAVYDDNLDIVLAIQTQNECSEKYSYSQSAKTMVNKMQDKQQWQVSIQKSCPLKETENSYYKFTFMTLKNNQSYLHETIYKTKNNLTLTQWHAEWGLPIKTVVNRAPTIFKYNSEGLITQMMENKSSRFFTYDELSRVNTLSYDRVPLVLTYNGDGDLRRIVKSPSQAIIYDSAEGIQRLPSSQTDRLIIQNVIRFVQNLK